MTKPWLRVIGDVHGKLHNYVQLATEAEYSLCVGDVGFNYDYLRDNLDATHHRIVGGNHDNYTTEICGNCNGETCDLCGWRGYNFSKLSGHFLNDFGIWQLSNFEPIFYVRGAWSIDKAWRIDGVSWWKDEELTYQQMLRALDLYEKEKPSFVITHTIPQCIVPHLPIVIHDAKSPKTEQFLENMYHIHQPKTWVFGHWHVDWRWPIQHPETKKITEFICLNELKYADFEAKP